MHQRATSSRLKAQRRPSAVGGALRLRLEAKWHRAWGRGGKLAVRKVRTKKPEAEGENFFSSINQSTD